MYIKDLKTKDFPKALPLRKLIGPSFILLGLGLGSGELILWPYLTSNYGLGIMWGALIGILLQFFMNMEIERYALVRGESIFVGFARKLRILSLWFLISTFIPWIWPGIAASAAKIFAHLFNIQNSIMLTIFILIVIGLILSLGSVLYKTVEHLQKYITLIGVPVVFLLSILLSSKQDWVLLSKGLLGIGEGYNLLPVGIPIASFLAALAYSGAGGNLNLAQSFYVREKGYGMGAYAEKIRGLFTGNKQDISIVGTKFDVSKENITEFNKWWKNINIEHFAVFFLTGAITMVLLGLLSYTTAYRGDTKEGLDFLFYEAIVIGQRLIPFAGTFFLFISALMLFSTQLGVFDATSRILAENLVLFSNKIAEKNIPKVYYAFLWLQIVAGAVILFSGVTQPLLLITIAAVLNAFAMFVHVGLTLWLNLTTLEKAIRPNLFRISMMLVAVLFYGGFSIYTLTQYIFN